MTNDKSAALEALWNKLENEAVFEWEDSSCRDHEIMLHDFLSDEEMDLLKAALTPDAKDETIERVCMCGSKESEHTGYDGHAYVDQREYHSQPQAVAEPIEPENRAVIVKIRSDCYGIKAHSWATKFLCFCEGKNAKEAAIAYKESLATPPAKVETTTPPCHEERIDHDRKNKKD